MRGAARHLVLLAGALCAIGATRARAQTEAASHGRAEWVGAGAALAVALVLDEPVQRFVASHRSRAMDDAANIVDPLGRAKYLVPALAAATVVPYAAGNRSAARAALRVDVAYAAADIAGGILRVAVARHRPEATGNAWRFRPLHPQGEWGSMPSAHVTHAFAIAAGIAEESGRPWIANAAYGLATLVAADRVYQQRHWTSDTIVGAAIGVAAGRAVLHMGDRSP